MRKPIWKSDKEIRWRKYPLIYVPKLGWKTSKGGVGDFAFDLFSRRRMAFFVSLPMILLYVFIMLFVASSVISRILPDYDQWIG